MGRPRDTIISVKEAYQLATAKGIRMTEVSVRNWAVEFGFGRQVPPRSHGRWHINRRKFEEFLNGQKRKKK